MDGYVTLLTFELKEGLKELAPILLAHEGYTFNIRT